MRNTLIHIVLWMLICSSCIEEYIPDVPTYEGALVVDGKFSNSENPSVVVLTRSLGYHDFDIIFVENAVVEIAEMGGLVHRLDELSPGNYKTNPDVFRGKENHFYQLRIVSDATIFESAWEELLIPAKIGGIEKEFIEKPSTDPNLDLDKGLQIFLNTSDTEVGNTYYRWSYLETYEFRVPFPSKMDYTENGEILPHGRQLETCWRNIESSKTVLANIENQESVSINKQPIHFISINSERLYIKYSILIRQHSIDKKAFAYHRNIATASETSGSLFDPIPTENFGNLNSVNDEVPVIGYFEVSGVDEQRIWVDRDELPFNPIIPTGFENCSEILINTTNPRFYNARIEFFLNRGLVLVDSLFPFISWQGFSMATPRCADCTITGTNVKPAFW